MLENEGSFVEIASSGLCVWLVFVCFLIKCDYLLCIIVRLVVMQYKVACYIVISNSITGVMKIRKILPRAGFEPMLLAIPATGIYLTNASTIFFQMHHIIIYKRFSMKRKYVAERNYSHLLTV